MNIMSVIHLVPFQNGIEKSLKKEGIVMSKQFKNLVSGSGECHQTNPLTGYASSVTGQLDRMRMIASSSSSKRVSEFKEVGAAAVEHPQLEGPDFYDFQPSSRLNAGPHVSGAWADDFASSSQVNFALPRIAPPQMLGPRFYPPAQYMGSVYTPQEERAVSLNEDLAAAKRMVEVLRGTGNPKFANSTFVDFIDQVANGDLKFRDGNVVDREGKQVNWDEVYEEEGKAASELLAAGDDAENFPDQMERIWNELRNDNGLEFIKQEGQEYAFRHQGNEYIDCSENLLEIAIGLMKEGRDGEALKALEAEVRVNSNSSEGWRLLGELHAQFDRDVDAIKCLEKGHLCDPFNLDSMMALGVSLTNELDSVKAMEVLRQWIDKNEKYHSVGRAKRSDDDVFYPDYDFSRLKQEVVSLFTRAAEVSKYQDPEVQVALGVLYSINRDHSQAISSFLKAVELRPHDFTAWNKLGATLANAGLSREALDCYHQALSLKPLYARAWSNLAIAHSNMEDYENAAKFLLTAIQISPDCQHLWTSLVLALSQWQPDNERFHVLIEEKDISGLINSVNGTPRIEDLPKPALSVDLDATLAKIRLLVV